MEIWKPIKNYEGIYEVSNLGRVRRIRPFPGATFKGRILKPCRANNEYHVVNLCDNCKQKVFLIHRLVAAAFVGQCPEGKEVNHKNGNRLDNRAENLEYMTRKENIIHASKSQRYLSANKSKGHIGSTNCLARFTEETVRKIKSELIHKHSVSKLAKMFNVHKTAIYRIKNGNTWTHV